MSFSGDIEKFTKLIKQRHNDVFVGVAEEVHRSVVTGSEITGAPGQPVDTGHLRGSWQQTFDGYSATSATNAAYARAIENNDGSGYDPSGTHPTPEQKAASRKRRQASGGKHIKSEVGGPHSVKLTIAGFDKIVDHVLKKVVHG